MAEAMCVVTALSGSSSEVGACQQTASSTLFPSSPPSEQSVLYGWFTIPSNNRKSNKLNLQDQGASFVRGIFELVSREWSSVSCVSLVTKQSKYLWTLKKTLFYSWKTMMISKNWKSQFPWGCCGDRFGELLAFCDLSHVALWMLRTWRQEAHSLATQWDDTPEDLCCLWC